MPVVEEGTEVAGGKHAVPNGVAVEELDGGKKKLSEQCPPDVKDLLEKKGVKSIYDDMVEAIVKESGTRSVFGSWKDKEFVGVVDLFRDQFADAGIKVVVCKRKSGSGTKRWIEFVDVDQAPDYVPMYDVENMSGQVIKTIYTTLEFPDGVAVEEFSNWGGRQKLKEKIPIFVEKMLTKKDLMMEYTDLVDSCVANGVGKRLKNWKLDKLKAVIEEFKPKFEAKGVAVFLSVKKEYVSHGQYGGHHEIFRWLEFVDREVQPDYWPQRDAETRDDCTIL